MSDVFSRARSMKDVPFLHLGRDRNGIDCIGLVAYAFEYPAEKIPPYPRDPLNGELERHLDVVLGPAAAVYARGPGPRYLTPGHVVALAYAGPVRHVGLVAAHPTLPGQLSLIHTDSRLGKVTEHILDTKWLNRICRVYEP